MTLLVGKVQGATTYIGADSGMWNEYQGTCGQPKVFRSGPVLIGAAGSFRVANILRYMDPLPFPERIEDPTRYVVRSVVPAIQAALQEAGWTMGEINEPIDGAFLIGLPGYLATITADLAVTTSRDIPYAAEGNPSATGVALGLLWALAQIPSGWGVEGELQAALVAGACHTSAVLPPFDILSVSAEEPERFPYLARPGR